MLDRTRIAQHARTGEPRSAADTKPLAVERGALLVLRLVEILDQRAIDGGQMRPAVDEEGGCDAPFIATLRESSRAVDRIDDPHLPVLKEFQRIGRFFG